MKTKPPKQLEIHRKRNHALIQHDLSVIIGICANVKNRKFLRKVKMRPKQGPTGQERYPTIKRPLKKNSRVR